MSEEFGQRSPEGKVVISNHKVRYMRASYLKAKRLKLGPSGRAKYTINTSF